jgi:hypothetical protein
LGVQEKQQHCVLLVGKSSRRRTRACAPCFWVPSRLPLQPTTSPKAVKLRAAGPTRTHDHMAGRHVDSPASHVSGHARPIASCRSCPLCHHLLRPSPLNFGLLTAAHGNLKNHRCVRTGIEITDTGSRTTDMPRRRLRTALTTIFVQFRHQCSSLRCPAALLN